ncbi:MAG: hypothetical protein R2813_00205 [Flavobacteriales bacterium]
MNNLASCKTGHGNPRNLMQEAMENIVLLLCRSCRISAMQWRDRTGAELLDQPWPQAIRIGAGAG